MNAKSSPLISDLCIRYSLGAEDVCFALLVGRGVDLSTAFKVVYGTTTKDPMRAAKRLLESKPQIEIIINSERGGSKAAAKAPMRVSKGVDLRSKSGVLDALENAYKSADTAKMQADILSKIADLQKMKNEEDREKEKFVNYYLPLRCEVCPWKAKSLEN